MAGEIVAKNSDWNRLGKRAEVNIYRCEVKGAGERMTKDPLQGKGKSPGRNSCKVHERCLHH